MTSGKSSGKTSKLKLVARAKAKTLGLTRYYTGVSCIYGHVSQRLTRSGACVACLKIKTRLRYRNDPELRRAKEKRYRDKHPDQYKAKNQRWRDSVGGYSWSAKFPEKRREWDKKKYDKNPEAILEKNRRWARTHPIELLARNQRRRAREKGAEGSFTGDDVSRIFAEQNSRCPCGSRLRDGYQVDHKTPLSRGGSNWPYNIQLLCPKCNGSKGTKTDEEWRKTLRVPS